MTDSIRIILPYLPPASYAANSRRHWSARRGKAGDNRSVLDDVRLLLAEQGWAGPVMERAVLTIAFGLPDKRVRDHGSLVERCKPVLDALTRREWHGQPVVPVIADDSLAVIGWPCYEHVESPGRPYTDILVQRRGE